MAWRPRPDGSRLYLSNESTEELGIVDAKTLQVVNSIPLSGRPNNVAIHENGTRVYVAIQGTGGGVDIIDTEAEENIRFIPILRGVHNTFITPDSKYVVAGSTGGGGATIIDTELERKMWAIHFEGGVRPFTFDTNPDGSHAEHVRPGHQPARVRRRRFRQAHGDRPRRAARTFRPPSATATAFRVRRRTASRSRRTVRRSGPPARSTATSTRTRFRISSTSVE